MTTSRRPLCRADLTRREYDLAISIGQAIRDARKRRGLTQRALSVAAQRSRFHCTRVELGHYMPGLRTIDDYCVAMGVSMAEIFAAAEVYRAVRVQQRASKRVSKSSQAA